MNGKVTNLLFFLISFGLIFHNIPKFISISYVGGIVSDKLVFYPLIIGIFYTIYVQCKLKNILIMSDKFLKFSFIYFVLMIISLILGLYQYTYFDIISNGPVGQINGFSNIIKIISYFSIDINQNSLLSFYVILKSIRDILFEIIYGFGGAYIIYCWYQDNWQVAFKILISALLLSLVVVFGYSFIEIFYLAGNEIAKSILVKITPYFHSINLLGSAYGEWPPILWYELRLRSIFAEPSYFGIFAGFSIPFLWYCINNGKNSIFYTVIFIIMSFLLFLTQARTATALLFGEMALLLLALAHFRQKFLLKTVFLIYLSTGIAFCSANYFINNYIDNVPKNDKQTVSVSTTVKNKQKAIKTQTTKVEDKKAIDTQKVKLKKSADQKQKTNIKDSSYLDKNFNSIFTANQRSNSARYAYIKSAFRVGLDHPVLGVGKGLTAAYMVDYFTDDEKKVGEVKRRIQRQNEVGILTAGMPILCEYARRFAETGIVGCVVYFAPLIYLLYSLFKKLKNLQYEYLFYMISLVGILASGFSLEFNGTYYYWLLLGLGYAMCFGKENKEQDI